MYAGMLTNVENLKMKSKSAKLQQERIDIDLGQANSAIGHQACAQQHQILFKLRSAFVGVGLTCAVQTAAQPVHHIREKPTVKLHRITRPPEHDSVGH